MNFMSCIFKEDTIMKGRTTEGVMGSPERVPLEKTTAQKN